MRQLIKSLCLVLAGVSVTMMSGAGVVSMTACSGGGDGGGKGGGKGGGSGGGGGTQAEAFAHFTLDPNAKDLEHFAMAVDPVNERVGVAYFTPKGTETHPGHPDYNLNYVEWNKGTVGTVETLRVVQRRVGISVAFDPTNGEPVVSFLGGDSGFVVGMSIFWFQSDMSIMRKSGGMWTESRLAIDSTPPACSPIDTGYLVGLWSQIIFNPAGKAYVFYRDGHNGQFPQQDWAASDVEVIEGSGTPAMRSCLTGDHKQAYGGRIHAALGAGDQPAVVYDQAFGGADVTGQNVLFQRRKSDGTWTPPVSLLTISNTMTGASIAYDSTENFGIAVTDRGNSQLKYIHADGDLGMGGQFTVPDEVFGSGTGGWYPSLAMDPTHPGEPAIAFYVCSPKSNVQDTDCLRDEDDLRVTQRIGGQWRETVVDAAGGWAPKLAFFASGKRVVAYRLPPALDSAATMNPQAGLLMLSVEK